MRTRKVARGKKQYRIVGRREADNFALHMVPAVIEILEVVLLSDDVFVAIEGDGMR